MKKTKNNYTVLRVILGVVGALLVIGLVIIACFFFLKAIYPNKKQETSKITKKDTKTVNNLYNIDCHTTEKKDYYGYLIGDKIECIITYNKKNKDFIDGDNELDQFEFDIQTQAVNMIDMKVTGPSSNELYFGFDVEQTDKNVKITNTREFTHNNDKKCEGHNAYCTHYYPEVDKIESYNIDSLKGIEIHLLFEVSDVFSEQKGINIQLTNFHFQVHDAEENKMQQYKTDISYQFDAENNQKYYINKDNIIYRIDGTKGFIEYDKIECMEYRCYSHDNDILRYGYAIILEDIGRESEFYFRLYDIDRKQNIKTNGYYFVAATKNNIYLLWTDKNDKTRYTITSLKDNKDIKTITKLENDYFSKVEVEGDQLIIHYSSGKVQTESLA